MLNYSAATAIGGREENQDALWVNGLGLSQGDWDETAGKSEGPLLALVCDGVGGGIAGKGASDAARRGVEAAWRELQEASLDEQRDKLLRQLAARAQDSVLRFYEENGGWGGTTLTLALVEPDGRFTLLNIGDSPALLVRQGDVTEVGFRQNLAGYRKRDGLPVRPMDGYQLMCCLGISRRGLLRDPLAEAWLAEGRLEPGDRLLLCSDGLEELPFTQEWNDTFEGKNEDQLLLDYLAAALQRGEAAAQLVRTAEALPGADNCTAILIERM